jgi:hypothetical protein
MLETQEREERFREEQKYLDEPLEMPTEKDKDGHDEAVANVFLRPPKGIGSKPNPQRRNNLMWQYPARSGSGEFLFVELAFASDDKDFAKKVVNTYQATEQFPAVVHDPPLPFESWEFNDAQYGYSINVSRGTRQVAIVYIFAKGRGDGVRKAIDWSLQSLAVDQQAGAARQRYNQKSPWRLQNKPGL